jgi:hypothetical protein
MSKPHKKIEWYEDENGCYICASHSKDRCGYPKYCDDKKETHMSRFIWQECFGEIPKGMLVCHKCDNPVCINPEHLFLGTSKDNMVDKLNKGRHRYKPHPGEESWSAKLTNESVLNIFKDKRKAKHIAAEYNVSLSTIYGIRKQRYWREVTAIA